MITGNPMKPIDPSEITSEHIYKQRRSILKRLGLLAASAVLAACVDIKNQPTSATQSSTAPANATATPTIQTAAPDQTNTPSDSFEESTNDLTAYEDAISFTNFYEFSFSKTNVSKLAENFKTEPWKIQVDGLVKNPQSFDVKELISMFGEEERIYRHRCVEAWSMVIPWLGFPLAKLLDVVQPTDQAKYIVFETLYDPEQMPQQKGSSFEWPYIEGLRLDEARHDLTILATGMYGKPLLPQNGAPIRLVVPWKYGFKGIKSIVKIRLTDVQPTTFWMLASPNEYGFYANVNPNVNHPRWSQATEYRIGKDDRVPTLMFNGYEEEVAGLYEGMDLRENF